MNRLADEDSEFFLQTMISLKKHGRAGSQSRANPRTTNILGIFVEIIVKCRNYCYLIYKMGSIQIFCKLSFIFLFYNVLAPHALHKGTTTTT